MQHNKTKKIYAMKSIRKDGVLTKGSVDALKLEKDILLNFEHPFLVGMDYVY